MLFPLWLLSAPWIPVLAVPVPAIELPNVWLVPVGEFKFNVAPKRL